MNPAESESEWMANLLGSRQLEDPAAGRSGRPVGRSEAPSSAAHTNKVESDLAAEGRAPAEAPRGPWKWLEEDPTPMETVAARSPARTPAVSGQRLCHLPA